MTFSLKETIDKEEKMMLLYPKNQQMSPWNRKFRNVPSPFLDYKGDVS